MGVVQGDVGGGGGTDATITFTDITTNDVSAAKHGFMPKLPNTATKFWRDDGTYQTISGGGDALVANPLSQFASTTSDQLATVLSDENGSGGGFVRATGATLTTPTLGAATATSVNKVAFTAPASAATLTIADGVTLTCSATVDTNNLAPKASPTLTTPTLGVASATSINKVAITAPATSATLTIADGATLTASATATVSGTNTGDQTNITGNAATVTTNANLTGPVTSTGNATAIANGAIALAKLANGTAGNLVTYDAAGVIAVTATGTSGQALLSNGPGAAPTFQTLPGGGDALTSNPLSQFASTTGAQFAGVISDKTGTGNVVFATSPTLVTPDIGVATATSVNKVAFTAPATSATITMTDGKTLSVTNNATISGTNTGDQTITGRLIGVQVLTSGSGATYTPTAGTASAVVEGWAEGGGGSGTAAANASQAAVGTGGGSGGYFKHRYAAISSGTYTVSSTGGTAGNNAGAAAGNGADTTFTDGTTLLTAKGGVGAPGAIATGTTTTIVPGADGGAISTNGNILNRGGACGGMALRTGTGGANTSISGNGGGENGGASRGTTGAGNNAKGIAGGGGGALALSSGAAAIGGAGGPGLIIVWEYSS